MLVLLESKFDCDNVLIKNLWAIMRTLGDTNKF